MIKLNYSVSSFSAGFSQNKDNSKPSFSIDLQLDLYSNEISLPLDNEPEITSQIISIKSSRLLLSTYSDKGFEISSSFDLIDNKPCIKYLNLFGFININELTTLIMLLTNKNNSEINFSFNLSSNSCLDIRNKVLNGENNIDYPIKTWGFTSSKY